MHPRLFTTPFGTIYTFGALLATAYIAAVWWVMREGRRERLDLEALSSLATWCICGAIIGAKALMIIRSLPELLSAGEISWRWVLSSAGDFYGGFTGAIVGAGVFFRRNQRLPFWRTADVCAPAIALGQAIGRIGCFMAGDDYGRPTQVPWAVTFTNPDASAIGGAPLGVPLHPVQVYESVVCAILFAVLVRLLRQKRFDGQVVLVYTLAYAIARFFLEFFRGDDERGFVIGWLSTSQLIAVILAPAAAGLLFALHRDMSRRRPR